MIRRLVRTSVCFAAFVLLCAAHSQAQGQPPATGTASALDSGPWPTQDHDNQRTNQSTFAGPAAPGTPTSIYNTGGPTITDFVVTSDGKILVGACANTVAAINLQGNPLWTYTLPASPPQAAIGFTVTANGNIQLSLHECPDIPGPIPSFSQSLSPSGTLNWSVPSSAMYFPSAVAGDGTIFQMDELAVVTAYDPNGNALWRTHLGGFAQGAIALDSSGNLYVGTDGSVYGSTSFWSLTPSGAIRWTNSSGVFGTTVISPADGVYVHDLAGNLYSYSTSGAQLWSFSAGGTPTLFGSIALGQSGTLYFQTSTGLFAVNPNGTQKWVFAPQGAVGPGSNGPVVDNGENLYFAFGNTVYSLRPDGSVRWSTNVPGATRLVIGGDGLLYASNANSIYLIPSSAGSTPAPAVSLSTTLLNFHNQTVNTTSGSMQVTVTNSGNATLNITATPTITGPNSGDFAIVNAATTCQSGAAIAPSNSCVINVTLTPSTTAFETATLIISDNAANSPQVVNLSGSGVAVVSAPVVSLSATSLFLATALAPSSDRSATSTTQGGWPG